MSFARVGMVICVIFVVVGFMYFVVGPGKVPDDDTQVLPEKKDDS